MRAASAGAPGEGEFLGDDDREGDAVAWLAREGGVDEGDAVAQHAAMAERPSMSL